MSEFVAAEDTVGSSADTEPLSRSHLRRTRWRQAVMLGGALVLATGFGLVYVSSPARSARSDSALVEKALKERLPRTQVTSVDCSKLPGVCEVVAGQTLFYTDHAARYLIIGRVYDMETRSDLTAARLLEMNPDLLLGSAAKVEGDAPEAPGAARPEPVSSVDLSALLPKGGIAWGPQSGARVTVFSDFQCSYCQKLHGELKALGVRVDERPISVLGTRKLSDAVYCASDPAAAVAAAYSGSVPSGARRQGCDAGDLDANEAFARRNGFTGTPVLVRADGGVLVGYRPAAQIATWLKDGSRTAALAARASAEGGQ